MAEDLTPEPPDDVQARVVPEQTPEPAAEQAPKGPPPYQARFQLIFGVLLGVALAAVAATVVFLTVSKDNKRDEPSAEWSVWRPTATTGTDAISEIAEHVGPRYTLPSGHQLVAVRGGPLELAGLPASVAIDAGSQRVVLNGNGVLYTLCGLGKYCSIKEGKPSFQRTLVLRREGLELALYTFRYISNVDEVVVIMPPRPGTKPTQALLFRRGDVDASLARPLAATLPGAPPAINRLRKGTPQFDFLFRLTTRNAFSYEPQQGGDARIYLVMQPSG